ncbi:transposase family protein [uncultured Actinomyces sp.]|uniref:transposase family protein n=1 Tax=uncultured Actinomyces sp. TaxID=249061 RepID=UPI0037DCEF31
MTNSSTRIPRREVLDLCETIYAQNPDLPVLGARVLGLFLCVRLTLTYLRRNPCQELLAEFYGIWQPTASRVIGAYTPLIAAALNSNVPTVEDLDPSVQLIVDGTLLECWSWKDHPELYSGRHRTTGLNVQVACTQSGTLAWVSDPQDGCTHDVEALRRSGLLDVLAVDLPEGASPPQHIEDKGYIGLGMITPKRKPANLPLHPDDKACNRTVNQVRYTIERVIANIKTWRVLHTGYRRPLETFPETITAVLGLIFTYTP